MRVPPVQITKILGIGFLSLLHSISLSSLFILKSLRLAGQFPSMRDALESESTSSTSIFYLLLELGLFKKYSSSSYISSVFSDTVFKALSIYYFLFFIELTLFVFWLKSYSNFGLFAPIPDNIFLNLF